MMVTAVAAGVAALALGRVATAGLDRRVERRAAPVGRFVAVGERSIHVVDRPGTSERTPIVFLHGASGNLRDPLIAFGDAFAERRRVFLDRPGHGWSGRAGAEDATPTAQAAVVAGVLDALGIDRAVVVGHSWGAAVAAAFAVDHAERTAGLVCLAPATHPWPGGVDVWHGLVTRPVIGPAIATYVIPLAGRALFDRMLTSVFAPCPVPEDLREAAGFDMVLRPAEFVANSQDMIALKPDLERRAPRYGEIAAPTLIVQGDGDTVVWPSIHAEALERQIANARLVTLGGVGHMPHHGARAETIDAIEELLATIDG